MNSTREMKTLARAHDKADVLQRLRRVRPDSVGRWGRMSAHQMVCHLSDAFRMALGRKPVSHASGVLQRTILKWIVLYVPLRWPPGILTRPEIDQERGGTGPIDFDADVAELERLVEIVTTAGDHFAWPVHPIFGGMSHSEWLAILDDKHPVVDLAHSLCLPRGELKEKISSMVAERFQMHSDLKTEAQKMLNSYLAASALYGEWRWEPGIGLRRIKRFGSLG